MSTWHPSTSLICGLYSPNLEVELLIEALETLDIHDHYRTAPPRFGLSHGGLCVVDWCVKNTELSQKSPQKVIFLNCSN